MRVKFLTLLFLSLLVLGCAEEGKISIQTPTPTPTPAITPMHTPTPQHTPTQMPATTPTPMHTPHMTPTATPSLTPWQPSETPTPFKLEYGVKYKVKVVEVVDGDTIDVIMPDGKEERVRMLGIDTPETAASKNKPYEYDDITNLSCLAYWGLMAKQYTESKLEGKYIYIELDPIARMRGYYGRLLAYIYYDSTDFTAELVKQGYARVYTEGNFERESEYVAYQSTAMENSVGLWTCSVEVASTPTLTPASTPTPTPTNTASTATVDFYYIHYDAAGNDQYNLNDEYVVIANNGAASINLQGWVLQDEAGHTYVFPSYTFGPGEVVYVHTGSGTDTAGHLYWGSDRAIWNNDGDTAYLFDAAGNLTDVVSW
ncbi:Micrococcal nuclease (thermonuclease)-like protein [Archaeoglobus sulfaticallidus PM70-1]|uniref:Micrococcal nuclease (Thermonuclease)-like protein n=1 Tax=Archaeoglobus sulfaticallidus PM70-1 TaxID=387631 RepID=N0BG95_9EURY|nr:lamin tail domain-containing protein [Archaeoglobus sulfaticallidus]AGK61322.1 Micrococcal nuclease (thermonuclease)-like protein [Archaeoglobus sulfaticallidus PM70-1]